jgi:peptidoglycan/LPS O-acetylase OafA/YrhL
MLRAKNIGIRDGGSTPAATSRGVLASIQVLRALAALGVAASHVQLDFHERLHQPEALPYLELGTAGVDLFFVISGFVMVYASGSLFATTSGPREFFVRRLIRILPLYWFCTTLYLLFPLLAPALARVKYPLDLAMASYLFIPYPGIDGMFAPVVSQGWTLNYEMLFYATFALAVALPRRDAVLAVALTFTLASCAGWLFSLPQPFAFWASPITLEFVLGCILGLLYVEGIRLGLAARAALVIGGILLWRVLETQQLVHLPSFITRGIPASMVLVGAAFGNRRHETLAARILSIVGDASYALYLLHSLFIRAFRELAVHVSIATPPRQWCYLMITLALATAAAVAVHYALERPTSQWLRRLSQPARALSKATTASTPSRA